MNGTVVVSHKEPLINWGKGIVVTDFYYMHLYNDVCQRSLLWRTC